MLEENTLIKIRSEQLEDKIGELMPKYSDLDSQW